MADGQGYSAGNLNFVIQAVGKESSNSLDKMNKSFKASAFSLTKLVNRIYFLRNYTKQLFRDLTGIIKKAVDYTETLNLWQVAMRGNREEAEDFVQTMNKAYGIATQTLMQYQAIFRNMLSSLGGVSDNVSYQLSEYLTQMAIDYASLYNVSIQRAMTTFQSVLSGQVRPIRSIAGYDITETTIFQLYQQLGGTKTMRQLSQTEKRLLRIYAVFQQMESSGAIGDLGKTMQSTANQFRMFTESTKELGTWLGIVIENYIRPLLPYLNATVITLTNIVKAFAQMNNISPQEFGVVESVEQLNEELDKVQGKLLSFDKFESLNSSASDGNILGIDEKLLAGMSKYTSILESVNGKAQELAEQWTALFINPDTGKWTQLTYDITDAVNKIAIILATIIAVTKPLLAVIASLATLYFTDEEFKKSIDSLVSSISKTIDDLIPAITKLVKDLSPILNWLFEKVVPVLVELVNMIVYLNGVFIDLNMKMYEWLTRMPEHIENVKNWLINFGNQVVTFFTDLWKSVVNGFAGAVTDIVNYFIDGFNRVIDVINIIPRMFGIEIGVPKIERMNWRPYKTGGLVEDGLFQMSRGEIVGEFDDGTTRVANNQQITAGIENASYRGITRGLREINFGGGNVYIDKKKVGQIIAKPSHKEMVRTGLVKVSS